MTKQVQVRAPKQECRKGVLLKCRKADFPYFHEARSFRHSVFFTIPRSRFGARIQPGQIL